MRCEEIKVTKISSWVSNSIFFGVLFIFFLILSRFFYFLHYNYTNVLERGIIQLSMRMIKTAVFMHLRNIN